MTLLYWPRWFNAMLVGLALALLLWSAPSHIPASSTGAVTTITRHGTVTEFRRVKRIVHGEIVTVAQRIYVKVPQIRVLTDHHWVTVPAHRLPLRSAAAATAMVERPVTVYVTVPVPVDGSPVTSTVTATVTTGVTVPTTVTVTLPGVDPVT